MNLGHTLGLQVRDRIREEIGSGYWYQIGSLTSERVRVVVEALDPVRYEAWRTQDDERTCSICGRLDGLIWPAGEGFQPPVHDYCRCERVYHHTDFRARFVEEWRDTFVPRTTWVWRSQS